MGTPLVWGYMHRLISTACRHRSRRPHLHPTEHGVEELANDEAGNEVGEHCDRLAGGPGLQGVHFGRHLNSHALNFKKVSVTVTPTIGRLS